MLRSLQFPMHTASENKYRRQHVMVSASKTKKQRGEVRLFMRQLPLVKRMAQGAPNRFEIKLIRIACAELDFVNLCGAMKGVQDEVAEWIGLDDRDPLIRWDFLQQRCKKGFYGVRVEVRDQEQGEDKIIVLGSPIAFLGPPAQSTGHGRTRAEATPKKRKKAAVGSPVKPKEQAPIVYVTGAYVPPWRSLDDGLELVELRAFENVDPAPPKALVAGPDGRKHELFRAGKFTVEDMGTIWLFAAEGFDPDEWQLARVES